MSLLLTGTAGFTGCFLQQQAKSLGYGIWPLIADLTDAVSVHEEILRARPSAVIHLAAISFVGHADDTAFYSVNVLGTLNLLSALSALDIKPQRVLLASSANIYGNCTSSPIKESQPAAPVNHYAASKLAMEHMARTYSDRLPIIITRPFNYTGPGQAAQFLIPKLVSHFAAKAERIELGNLHVEREFNDVRMICEAYLQLIDKGTPGETYNICSGNTYTLKRVISLLQDITGHGIDVDVNPAFVRANEVHRLCGDPSKLLDATGSLTPWTLEDTLRAMLHAHRNVA